jgi:hypothetical protein
MGYIKDIIALNRWITKKQQQGEQFVYDRLTPEGQKRYRRWRKLSKLFILQRLVTGRWPWPL